MPSKFKISSQMATFPIIKLNPKNKESSKTQAENNTITIDKF